ncbi:YciI family protein [Synechococcus sp. UW105]|uniref:YciI family protein n=1 Tax=Synechococcus sp. UW105 TaxID=337067 RepID=UPI000E0F952E|nr:YciI family protein [Synechococcus sp. UW105]|tara:strand:+ start:270 stop:578 length:309 start_codon:yes stop_codon:yes gene_type:complete
MAWFIKQEIFTDALTALPVEERRVHLSDHRQWVEAQRSSGVRMASGFLVDGEHKPGGGGLLLFEAPSYASALELIRQDPMICRDLVTWSLHEWVPVSGELQA